MGHRANLRVVRDAQNHCALCGRECGAAFGCDRCYPPHRPTNAERAAYFARTGESVAASVSRAQRSRGPSIAGRIVVAVFRGIAAMVRKLGGKS